MIDVQQIFNLVGAVVLCELVVQLLRKAGPLAPLRRLLKAEDDDGYPTACDDEDDTGCAWYSSLLSCGYCLSVWMGVLCAILLGVRVIEASWWPMILIYVINGLIVHRMSNMWHAVLDRIFDFEGRLRSQLPEFEIDLDAYSDTEEVSSEEKTQ